MNIEELLQKYPTRRIKPADGMAITADVWEEAHEFHRQSQGIHALVSHGMGILTGLEVIASDPPDTALYILPGIAIDPLGQTIVLPQPVSYDIGNEMDGLFYLNLSYGESRPRTDNGNQQEGAPLFVHGEFSITAQSAPAEDGVELARVRRSSRELILLNARLPFQPRGDEIDLRFRHEVGAPGDVQIAVSYLGDVSDMRQGLGATYLAQALNHTGAYRIAVEDNVAIGPGIVNNTLVYLVGQGKFELGGGVMNGLRNYVHRGNGTLLIESLDVAAEEVFLDFLTSKDMKPQPIEAHHRLLIQPNVFAAPPAGYETEGTPRVEVSDGVVFTTNQYGLIWLGERRGRLASREEIRSATEWGSNLMFYAMNRRRGL